MSQSCGSGVVEKIIQVQVKASVNIHGELQIKEIIQIFHHSVVVEASWANLSTSETANLLGSFIYNSL